MTGSGDRVSQSGSEEELQGQIVRHKENGSRYVIGEADGEEIILDRLGNRMIEECPVEYGDECIDPNCDGRVGETERDEETLSAHELYCYGCGLNWVERGGGYWEEGYADWPTSFSFEEGDDAE